jgi:hypothetical protein
MVDALYVVVEMAMVEMAVETDGVVALFAAPCLMVAILAFIRDASETTSLR